jgi:peroxiredoxin/tetratricopeptide (TPR) repeat protein
LADTAGNEIPLKLTNNPSLRVKGEIGMFNRKTSIAFILSFFIPIIACDKKSDTEKAKVYFTKGIERLNENNWTKAGEYFREAIQYNLNHQLAHEKYQDVEYYYFERKDEVLKEYRELYAKHSQDALFSYLLARILDSDEKTKLLQKALSIDPTFVPAYRELLGPLVFGQKYEEASKIFETALLQCPNSIDLLLMKAQYLLRKGEPQEAIKTYRYIISGFRDSPEIAWAYRDIADLVDDPQEKTQLLENVLKYNVANRLFALYERLYGLYEQDDPLKAEQLARKAVSVKPPIEDRRVPSSGYRFLYNYYSKQDPSKAIEIVQELARSEVHDPDLYAYIGNRLVRDNKEIPLAIKLLERSIRFNTPENAFGLRAFGRIGYSALRKNADAQEAYFRSSLGWAYYKNADYKSALKMLQSASGRADWAEAEIQYRLGQVYEKIQQWEAANSAYIKSLAVQEDDKVRKAIEDLGEKVTNLKVLIPSKKTTDIDSLIAEAQLAVTKNAPDFTLRNMDNQNVSLSDYRGKVVLLDFWATWCGPCRAELPHFQKLMDSFKDNPSVAFITISTDITAEVVKIFCKENKYTFPVLMDKGTTAAYGVQGIPVLLIIDQDGNIRYKHEGFDSSINIKDLVTKEINLLAKKQR